MEPYNQYLPFIRFRNDGKTWLDRMVEAGIPFSRALQYFRDNPEGSALETLKTAVEDVVPFYGSYRNGGDWKDYIKEAVMLAMPTPKGTKGPKQVDIQATKQYNEKLRNMGYPELAAERPITPADLEWVRDEFFNHPEMANAIVDGKGYGSVLETTKDAIEYSADNIYDTLNEYQKGEISLDEAKAEFEDYPRFPGGLDDGQGLMPEIKNMTVGDFDYLDRAVRQNLIERGITEATLNEFFGETPYNYNVSHIIEDPNLTPYQKRAKIELLDRQAEVEKAIDDLPGDDRLVMFRLNPDVQMDILKKLATKRAIREWNEAVNNMPNNPRPQKIDEPVTYDQPIMNNLNDAIAKNYKFTPKSHGDGMFWKEDPNIVTDAIIPEDVRDAAWLHHNPQMSNYDFLFGNKAKGIPSALNVNVKKLIDTGNLKSKYPDVDWQYDEKGNKIAKYKTVDGRYETTGQRAKSKIANILESKFPGYKKALNTPRNK